MISYFVVLLADRHDRRDMRKSDFRLGENVKTVIFFCIGKPGRKATKVRMEVQIRKNKKKKFCNHGK